MEISGFNCGNKDQLGISKDKSAKYFKYYQYRHIAKLCRETISSKKEVLYVIIKIKKICDKNN